MSPKYEINNLTIRNAENHKVEFLKGRKLIISKIWLKKGYAGVPSRLSQTPNYERSKIKRPNANAEKLVHKDEKLPAPILSERKGTFALYYWMAERKFGLLN